MSTTLDERDVLLRRAEKAEADSRTLRHHVRELHTQLRTDQLTGIANRLALTERFTHHHATVCSVLLLDLNQFKQINDVFGHRAGDLVLLEVATRLREVAEHGDLAVRISGDEFAMWLRPTDNETRARFRADHHAKAIHESLTAAIDLGYGRTTQAAASIGVSVATTPNRLEDLLESADLHMYTNKPVTQR